VQLETVRFGFKRDNLCINCWNEMIRVENAARTHEERWSL
jgi:hypothetical protein